MTVKYMCDCCNSIFEAAEFEGAELGLDRDSLTDGEESDIIKQDDDAKIFVTRTCDECNKAIGLDEDEFLFYSQPIIN